MPTIGLSASVVDTGTCKASAWRMGSFEIQLTVFSEGKPFPSKECHWMKCGDSSLLDVLEGNTLNRYTNPGQQQLGYMGLA